MMTTMGTAEMEKEKKDVYEISRGGETVCRSSIPMLGYPEKLLRQMVADGHRYYVNGKLQRKIES